MIFDSMSDEEISITIESMSDEDLAQYIQYVINTECENYAEEIGEKSQILVCLSIKSSVNSFVVRCDSGFLIAEMVFIPSNSPPVGGMYQQYRLPIYPITKGEIDKQCRRLVNQCKRDYNENRDLIKQIYAIARRQIIVR